MGAGPLGCLEGIQGSPSPPGELSVYTPSTVQELPLPLNYSGRKSRCGGEVVPHGKWGLGELLAEPGLAGTQPHRDKIWF